MPVTRRYGCPDCGHEFSFLHLNKDEPPPQHCPSCGEYMGADPPPIPGAPNIGTIKGKVVDRTYRQLEESGEIRAALTGDPSHKITNLKDGLREGDIAAIPPQPSQQYKDALKITEQSMGGPINNWGMGAGIPITEAVAMAKSGAHEGTGASVMEAIQGAGSLFKQLPKGFKPSWGGG